MRLIDKDKLLEELTEGQKAGLGLIEGSEYDNINNVDDAIEAVKYADEVDLSELKPENAVSINSNNGGDVVEIKDLNDGTSSVFIGTACVPIIQGIYKNEMLPRLIFDVFIEGDIDKALKNVESFKISNDRTVLNSDGLSQPLPTIDPFGRENHICVSHSKPIDNKPERGYIYDFVNKQNSIVHICVDNMHPRYVDISFKAGTLYKSYVTYMTEEKIKPFLNEDVVTRIAENVFAADKNMSPQDWSNDYKTLFARVINDELCEVSSMQIAEDVQADLEVCNNEYDDEEDEERASEISENFEKYDDEEDGFDPGDDD